MSPKASPLLGYNNNVRHKGRVFHIQTEDSGVRYGHIITHLFMDGGRILKSVKTSYAEHAGSEQRVEIVRELMKQQHRAMFIALRDGKFDPLVDGHVQAVEGALAAASQAPPAPVKAAASVHSSYLPDSTGRRVAATATASAPVRGAGSKPAHAPTPVPPIAARPAVAKASKPKPAVPKAAVPKPALTEERERRYAPSRPASAFGQARPQQGKTMFGEDILNDKSLDEVILSYLSAELDEKK